MWSLISLLALAAGAAGAQPAPVLSRSNRLDGVAVVVGVESYRGALPPARYARHDAEVFADFAQHTLGIPRKRIKLLVDQGAGLADLREALDWAVANSKPTSTVVFYFSGHGTPRLKSGSPMLVPYDADPADLERRSLEINELVARLAASPGAEKLVFVDACFSGVGARSVSSEGKKPMAPVQRLEGARGVLYFAAATSETASGSSSLSAHGLFTHHLLAGLRGAADDEGNADEVVTAAELKRYVERHVEAEAKEQGSAQRAYADIRANPGLRLVEQPGLPVPQAESAPDAGPPPVVAAAPDAGQPGPACKTDEGLSIEEDLCLSDYQHCGDWDSGIYAATGDDDDQARSRLRDQLLREVKQALARYTSRRQESLKYGSVKSVKASYSLQEDSLTYEEPKCHKHWHYHGDPAPDRECSVLGPTAVKFRYRYVEEICR